MRETETGRESVRDRETDRDRDREREVATKRCQEADKKRAGKWRLHRVKMLTYPLRNALKIRRMPSTEHSKMLRKCKF